MTQRIAGFAFALACWLGPVGFARAGALLMVETAHRPARFTPADLLARADCATLHVTDDVYHGRVAYRAVPLLALVGEPADTPADVLEARASDGFASQIPLALIARGAEGGAVAWLAVEDPAHPWPPLPHGEGTAGPFYLIWQYPERSDVSREQWPYQVVSLAAVESPSHRWPQLAVSAGLPADAPARHGQAVFIANCLPCHRLRNGGAGTIGPDLGQPMSPTRYLTETGLRAIIRSPAGVRTWPAQQMPGFDKAALPDDDLDALVAYLKAKAESP